MRTAFVLSPVLFFIACAPSVQQQPPASEAVRAASPIELGEEYVGYEREAPSARGRTGPITLRTVSLYLPNRLLDFWDIFRVDVGVGPSLGASLKLSSSLQFSYRRIKPFSLRLGALGRRFPAFVEKRSEIGIGSDIAADRNRRTGDFEIGAGAELLVLGVYAGVCLDESIDFVLGIFGIDVLEDDFR